MKLPNLNGYKYRGRFLGWGGDPLADWEIMFSVFLILLSGIAIWCATVFMEAKGRDMENAVEAEASPLNIDVLKRTAGYYERQRLDFEALRTTPETTPDPSR